ncbi:hypothetical protein WDW86_05945 [Bdellovibrionota bacterium FG-2]
MPDANLKLEPYGELYIRSQIPDQHGLQFGFGLQTSVFLKDSWVGYQSTLLLPNDRALPGWITTPVIDVVIPKLNTKEVSWHFYFSTEKQYVVGVAAVVTRVGSDFDQIDVGMPFWDENKRLVLQLSFFSPKKDTAGNVLVPGGAFIATDLAPFLPKDFQPMQSGEPMELAGLIEHRALDKAIAGEIQLTGADKDKIHGKKDLEDLIKKYAAALPRN